MVLRISQVSPQSMGELSQVQAKLRVIVRWPVWLVLILALSLTWPSALSAQETKATEGKQKSGSANLELSSSAPTDEKAISAAVKADTDTAQATPAVGNGLVSVSKASVLVGSLTVFLLAVFVGFEVITKVPPTLHTPLMSGSNAISGITVVGAMLTAGSAVGGFGSLLGLLAVVLAMVNVVGGFLVTHRMLMMFKKR